jgi:hypothetical protein
MEKAVISPSYAVFISMALRYSWKLSIMIHPVLFFLLTIALAIQGLCASVLMLGLISVRNALNFDGDCIELIHCFW